MKHLTQIQFLQTVQEPEFSNESGSKFLYTMEDFDLGKPSQKASSSVESDIKNSPHSLGLNLNTSR